MYKNRNIIRAVILAGFLIFGFLLFKSTKTGSPGPDRSGIVALQEQSNVDNNVTVRVQPINISNGIDFEIELDTHSVELNYDLVAISKLSDNKGREYFPVSWEGYPLGGHHRKGILKFTQPENDIVSIRLDLNKVAGVDRVFQWDLNK